jgi:dolichyl-phosphate-mannose-protein mannosyltransferase
MATSNSGARQRGGYREKKQTNGKVEHTEDYYLDNVVESSKNAVTSEWDYNLGLLVITVLSFITRFWGISHPNEVVFDEVHFGKVGANSPLHTQY